MKKFTHVIFCSLIISCFLLFISKTAFAWCAPAPIPANPVSVVKTGTGDTSDCIVKVLRSFNKGEEVIEEVMLTRGTSYWFSASGCPRMGNISISVVNSNGELVKESVGYSPNFCFQADNDGAYSVKVKAVSMTGTSTYGNIESCFSASGCK